MSDEDNDYNGWHILHHVLEMVAMILFVTFIFGLFFVFSGTPDLWDRMRWRAMDRFALSPDVCWQDPQVYWNSGTATVKEFTQETDTITIKHKEATP